MEFKLDPHVHMDFDRIADRWHGVPPKILAMELMNPGLDGIAVTDHYKPSRRMGELREELARLQEREEIQGGTKRNILILTGFEATVVHEGTEVHIGHIFQDQFDMSKRDDVPRRGCTMEDFLAFTRENPGMTIFNHPSHGHGLRRNPSVAHEIAQIGGIHGIEILNGRLPWDRFPTTLLSSARTLRPNLAEIGGGDIHYGHATFLGDVYTEVEIDKPLKDITGKDVVIAMIQGRTRAASAASLF